MNKINLLKETIPEETEPEETIPEETDITLDYNQSFLPVKQFCDIFDIE
jgi:hypothetical protein